MENSIVKLSKQNQKVSIYASTLAAEVIEFLTGECLKTGDEEINKSHGPIVDHLMDTEVRINSTIDALHHIRVLLGMENESVDEAQVNEEKLEALDSEVQHESLNYDSDVKLLAQDIKRQVMEDLLAAEKTPVKRRAVKKAKKKVVKKSRR